MNPFSIEPLRDVELLAENEDGCPKAPEGRAVPPWLRVEKMWRVVPLALGKMPLFPPEVGGRGEEFIEEDHISGQGFQVPMVVLGPAGAGLTTFHRWLQLRVEKAGRKPVELDFARIGQTDDPAQQRSKLVSTWLDCLEPAPAPCADLADMLDDLLQAGSEYAPSNEKPRSHIMVRVDQLHPDIKEVLLGRLVDLVERRALQGARIVVLAHETAPLEDTEPFSSFLDVCAVFRLADFTAKDVAAMWRDWVPTLVESAEDVAQSCIKWTGGQPALVNLFLGRLFDVAKKPLALKDGVFDEVGAWLEEHPPRGALQHWRRELARLVLDSGLLRRKMRNFVAGEVRASVTREELPLFLSGWIGQKADGSWAVRSDAHARWAVGPLHTPERFSRVDGGR